MKLNTPIIRPGSKLEFILLEPSTHRCFLEVSGTFSNDTDAAYILTATKYNGYDDSSTGLAGIVPKENVAYLAVTGYPDKDEQIQKIMHEDERIFTEGSRIELILKRPHPGACFIAVYGNYVDTLTDSYLLSDVQYSGYHWSQIAPIGRIPICNVAFIHQIESKG